MSFVHIFIPKISFFEDIGRLLSKVPVIEYAFGILLEVARAIVGPVSIAPVPVTFKPAELVKVLPDATSAAVASPKLEAGTEIENH